MCDRDYVAIEWDWRLNIHRRKKKEERTTCAALSMNGHFLFLPISLGSWWLCYRLLGALHTLKKLALVCNMKYVFFLPLSPSFLYFFCNIHICCWHLSFFDCAFGAFFACRKFLFLYNQIWMFSFVALGFIIYLVKSFLPEDYTNSYYFLFWFFIFTFLIHLKLL